MIEILITPRTRGKIEEIHEVTETEVEEAFFNHDGPFIEDDRRQNRTKPPTYWFISSTVDGRILKIVVKYDVINRIAWLKSAYEPSDEEIEIYEAHT